MSYAAATLGRWDLVRRALALGVVVVVLAGAFAWWARRPSSDAGAGPWQPASATIAYCLGVIVERPDAPGRSTTWTSSILGPVPDEWKGLSSVSGEFRRLADRDDAFLRRRAEFRSGDVRVELVTGISVDCN